MESWRCEPMEGGCNECMSTDRVTAFKIGVYIFRLCRSHRNLLIDLLKKG